jgi:hypothetical protein
LTSCTGLPPAGVVGTAAILGANTFTALQTHTQASANAGIIASTGYSLTGTDATNMVDLAGTWNTSGVPTVLKMKITNTASGNGSMFWDCQVGAGSLAKLRVSANTPTLTIGGAGLPNGSTLGGLEFSDISGNRWVSLGGDIPGLGLISSYKIVWTSSSTNVFTGVDSGLARNAAGVVEVNSGSAGTFRDLKLRNLISPDANGSYIQTPGMAVGSLPASPVRGMRCYVTDSNATSYTLGIGAVVANGGTTVVPVFYDGTNWRIG